MFSYPERGSAAVFKTGAVLAVSSLAVSGAAKYQPKIEKAEQKQAVHHKDTLRYVGNISLLDRDVDKIVFFWDKTIVNIKRHEYGLDVYAGTPGHPLKFVIKPLTTEEKRIAGCESAGSAAGPIRYHIPNKYSSATGGFQFESIMWQDFDNYARAMDAPPLVQNEKAEKVIHEDGTWPWESSESCWGQS